MTATLPWTRPQRRPTARPGSPHAPVRATHGALKRRHGRVVDSAFVPHPLLKNAHVQTMLAELLRPAPELEIRRERLELPDGDFVDLGWSGPRSGGPLAILVHGFAGSFGSHYVRGMARGLLARGWRTVILQLRGAGAEPNRLARCYHHGDTEDFRHLCHLLRAHEPHTPIAAVGWSLGANIVLKALGEERHASPLNAGVGVSAPFRLEACAAHLRNGAARIYQAMMLRHMKKSLRVKHERGNVPVPDGVDLQRALRASDFMDLGDVFTAPMVGFRDAIEYCRRMECGRYLNAIRRPTLVVHALDDPFMVPSIIPKAEELAPQVRLELSAAGGHVGFVEAGEWGQPEFWLERRVPDFLSTVVGQKAASPRAELRVAV